MDFFYSQRFPSHVEGLMNQHHVPASVEPPKLCTADTLFDIASCSKSLTAASVALLVDDNENYPEVQYDTIMSNLLPDDFVMPDVGYTEGVTVQDILSHRTGMAAHNSSYLSPRAAQPDDARSITRNLRNLPMAAPIRAKYIYCNMMYTVATYLVEVKSKQSFSDFLQKHFFRPLDMQSTSLQPESARAKGFGDRIATGYCWKKNSATYHGFQSPDCPESQGAGSIITSVNDFIKWVKALMNCQGPISDKVYQDLVRMRTIINPNTRWLKPHTSPAVYAAGVEIYYYRGHMIIGHNGVTSGFGSRFFFLPNFKFGAVLMGNSTGASTVATILARELIDEVLKVPEAERSYRNKTKKMHSSVKGNVVASPKDQAKDEGRDQSKNKSNDKSKDKENMPQIRKSRSKNSHPQEIPLNAYIGKYRHPGYHTLTVQVRGDKLFIDATDRSMGFTLTFHHVSEQTKYSAHLSDLLEGGDDPVPAEFIFEDGRAGKLGLQLESALKEMIWFDRVDDS
ncbi:beta-lactamase/transpeptidase-like protein [Zopfia rhizophila CBS 207.26]|uniref:Beta-lactamase/transpeptidase-like protein n=1 Tax=Zopfia rhizophila CBS 207.26 TaxID=1314779 RepID=A0A6A6DCG9_9PEZI|nr:beta-lactamase/transpeptidase-like protein [Zopfia rhizophila CBS 207.26]